MLQRELEREGSSQADRAAQNVDAIGEAITLSRSFARSLAPVTLDSNGLSSALQLLAKSTGTILGIVVDFQCPQLVVGPDPDTATQLYRIAQALIANAAKHARSTRIEMRLIRRPTSLLLEVANDGLPFSNPGALIEGMGLNILRARADTIGAIMEFIPSSTPDGGTLVRCNLPLPSSP
jgi:signal transduction histidine kinase